LIEWTIKGYAGDMMERFKKKSRSPRSFSVCGTNLTNTSTF